MKKITITEEAKMLEEIRALLGLNIEDLFTKWNDQIVNTMTILRMVEKDQGKQKRNQHTQQSVKYSPVLITPLITSKIEKPLHQKLQQQHYLYNAKYIRKEPSSFYPNIST